MDNMPEVTRCFGMFPPKYATYLISIFGLGMGGTGIAGIVLYGLVEKAVTAFFFKSDTAPVDDTVKKCVLLTIGLTSLLLTIASFLMFLGATSGSPGPLAVSIWIIFAMDLILIGLSIAAPMSCFFMESTCVVKKLSTTVLVLCFLVITVFLEVWLYFMVVANAYLNEIA
ncbi:uncharacterized protein LOC123705415 [Colias croceus]|uniref:uncharacterized protein LOC123705415 n=1 Tax=Colias crocea TaxID=72248 RepID=UPI001E27A2E4|nr:uncharacterized protein LOC123705415 [Colias croceus]